MGEIEDIEIEAFPDDEALDYNWVTERLAVGGAVWNAKNMRKLADEGITHVVSLQANLDDSEIVGNTGIQVCWVPCHDDCQEKPPELFQRAIDFALDAYKEPHSRIYFHCAAGEHRGPMMLLAFLGALGMPLTESAQKIHEARPKAKFPDEYRRSVVRFLSVYRAGIEQE